MNAHPIISFTSSGEQAVIAVGSQFLLVNLKTSEISQPSEFTSTYTTDVLAAAVSDDFRLIATGGEDKSLHFHTSSGALVHKCSLDKKVTTLAFIPGLTDGETTLLTADRYGDILAFDIQSDLTVLKPRLLIGHLSVVVGSIPSLDRRYLISCDRDSKIRVSGYPNTFDIAAYCLGHTASVASITTVPHQPQLLISSGGDGSVRLWKFADGELLRSAQLAVSTVTHGVCCSAVHPVCAASVEGQNAIHIIRISDMTVQQRIDLQSAPSDFKFDQFGRLWILAAQPFVSMFAVDAADGLYKPTSDGLTNALNTHPVARLAVGTKPPSFIWLQISHEHGKPGKAAAKPGTAEVDEGR
eukprot:TRINITY_DN1035_c0_g1_i1.p1 TRINITY_DN1035_c0_g1~~TRINITY_DN1035_c0_g1_i1.p1  ORF type:complete len:355 (+),score=57.29 TRINITY_DN1035_c0_g1_i1:915-1979(+)